MLKKILGKKGSAYLMAIGVLGVIAIAGVMISKLTTSGRWNTILSSNEKRAEEIAESATNLTFKIVKEEMNNHDFFWRLFSKPSELLNSWFMYFRLPAFVANAYMDPVTFNEAKSNGVDIQLDLFNNTKIGLFKNLYLHGLPNPSYVFDSVTDDKNSKLYPLKSTFDVYGGRVRVKTKARIVSAFGILADSAKYQVGGVEVPLRKVTGFLGNLFEKVKIKGDTYTSKINSKFPNDPTGNENEKPNIDLLNLLPDEPLFKAPSLEGMTYEATIVPPVVIPIGVILQPILDSIFKKIIQKLDLTVRGLAKRILGDSLSFSLDFSAITDRIEEAINNLLPDCLKAFAGNVGFGVTIEKQGVLEVETLVKYWPNTGSDKCIVKKLLSQREFRVADIQPIAPEYSFFVANSPLLYEHPDFENQDNWEGDDAIDWNAGHADLTIHNMPSIKEILAPLKDLFKFDLKKLVREINLPGLVRVNGTKKMRVKLGMFTRFPPNLDSIKDIEIAAMLLGHKDGAETACSSKHSGQDDKKHRVIPDFKVVMYNFWDNSGCFDWGYFGGGSPGGLGTYWIPLTQNHATTQFFGNFHIEFPFSMRVEGYLTKVYSHIKMLLVKILIPPFPPWFTGLEIPIPWLWANAMEEPYGFCNYPPYKKEEEAAKAWDPKEACNLPANVYAPSQYVKKASYFYNRDSDFHKDYDNRCIEYNGKKTFICDGVTFVNDNLWLDDMHIMGRGIIVAAGNIHLGGNITRETTDKDGNSTIFSLVARNGGVITDYGNHSVDACIFADRGLQTKGSLKIHGNLCVNRCKRDDLSADVDVYYQSRHCRSSLLSMIKAIAKYDPTRYHVTLSSKLAGFRFEKPTDEERKND